MSESITIEQVDASLAAAGLEPDEVDREQVRAAVQSFVDDLHRFAAARSIDGPGPRHPDAEDRP